MTNEESKLYAGVEGSMSLSVNTGTDADACKLKYGIVDGLREGGGGSAVRQSELWEDEDVRKPKVEGNSIDSGSSVDATYRVRARGAGATSSVRLTCEERCR